MLGEKSMDWIWQPMIGNLAVTALTISVWLHVKRHLRDRFSHFFPILFGALLGVSAVVTMVMTIQVQPGVFFDLRSSLVGVAALFGGPVAGVIALLPPLVYRLYLGGQGAMAGASLIIASGVLGLVGHYWSAKRPVRFSTALLLASAIASVTLISIALIPSIAAEGR
jgi:LytS/YehU family sensor histidine kinase